MSELSSPELNRSNEHVRIARLAIQRCGDAPLSPNAEDYFMSSLTDRDIALIHFLTLRRECEREEQAMQKLLNRGNQRPLQEAA
jgi:hypothetical protein